jgi:hypothetical protein
MGAAKLLLVLLLHGADQKELASTRPEIVSLIERRRLSTVFNRSKQTTRRRKDKIWQKQYRLKRSWQKKGVKKAKVEKTPLRRQRKAKWVAVIGEGDLSFARTVGLFVMSSKKRGTVNGTHAATAASIITSNLEICDQAPLTPFESNGPDRAGVKPARSSSSDTGPAHHHQ